MYKRGQQSGTEASILILVITILIVIYIMFLPAGTRMELLDQTNNKNIDDNTNTADVVYNLTLIDETPGRLDYIGTKEYEHDIPSINLYSTTDAAIIKTIAPFVIKNNWFEKKFESISFSLDDFENTNNLQLSFI